LIPLSIPAAPAAAAPTFPQQVITMTASQHPRQSPVVWRAARRVAAALWALHEEQGRTWDPWWQANRATVPESGALTWVLTLDGYRLSGSHLPARDTGAGGTP
jgi:hypothetical protein